MGQLTSQSIYQLRAIFGTVLASLFFLDDAPANVPIGLNHRTAYRTVCLSTTIVDDGTHITHQSR